MTRDLEIIIGSTCLICGCIGFIIFSSAQTINELAVLIMACTMMIYGMVILKNNGGTKKTCSEKK